MSGPPPSVAHVVCAALLEFLPAGAGAGVVTLCPELDGRVDEVPAPVMLDERRTLVMLVVALLVVPAGGEGDEGMFRLATKDLGAFDFQSQPGALGTPRRDGGTVQAGLLGR